MKTKTPLFRFDRLLIAAIALLLAPLAQAQLVTNVFFFDDFDRANGATLGSATNPFDSSSYAWSKAGLSSSAVTLSSSNLSLASVATNGREWAYAELTNTAGFNTTYSSSAATSIEWYFNMRQGRGDPAGFGSGSYAPAFILGANSSALTNSGTFGYAIVYGQSGTTDPIRLVSFTNGLTADANLTTIITATNVGADIGNQYLSLKLAFDVSTTTWTLTGTTNSSFVDPWSNGSMLSLGSAVNSTYTSSNLSFMGAFWNHATGTAATNTALFDNFRIASVTNSAAASYDWTGGSGNWSTGFAASAPTNGSALIFSAAGGGATTNDVSSLAVTTITFGGGAGSFTNSGNPFTISNGIVNNSANAQIFSNAITLGAAQTFTAAAGAMTFAGDIANGGNLLTVAGASNTVVSGILSGAAGLTKNGLGTLTLNGINTFVGAVTANGGVISVDNDSELGDAANDIVFGGGTLQSTASFAMAAGRDISGTGTLDIASGTTLTNSGTVNMTALTLANTGTFEMSGASKTLNSLTFSVASTLTNTGAAAVIGGNVAANNASGTVVMAGAYDLGTTNRTFTVSNGSAATDMQITGSITNTNPSGYLIKAGAGRLEISGNNSGMAGGLQLGSAGAAAAGELVVTSKEAFGQAQFRLNSGTLLASTDLTGANAITNGLSIGGRAANAAIIGGANAIEFTGGVSWFGAASTASTLQVNNATTLSGVIASGNTNGVTFEFAGTGSLTLSGASANTFTNAVTISNTGLTVIVGKNDAFGTTAAGTTLQSGSTIVLNSVNYSTAEDLTISGAGVGGGGALQGTGTSVFAGAITAAANTTISANAGADLTLSGNLGGGGNTLTVGGAGNVLLSGAVSNGNVSKSGAGSLTISNASSSLGTLTTGTGTTAVATNATATGLAGSGALDLAGGTFTLNNSAAQTFSGAISGGGAFVKTGAGTATLSGNSGSFTGATTVTNGTLVVNGNLSGSAVSVGHASSANGSVLMGTGSVGATTINTNGRISPGNSVGVLSVSNTLTLNGGGSYLWEITNSTANTPGVGWDLITVDTATAGDGLGTLNLPGSGQFMVNGAAIDGFVFDGNSNYTNNYFLIVEAANVSGSLGNLAFLGTGLGSGAWTFSTNSTGLFLNYTAPAGEITFTNIATAFQGDADIATPAGPWGLIDGSYAVVVNGGGTVIMTNSANSYSGTTTVKNGTLQADVDAGNGVNGAFGNAITAIAVGDSTGSANATLDIGADGVTVGRAVNVVAGSTGTKTLGTSLNSGTATYSGAVSLDAAAALSSGGTANAVFSGLISGTGGVTKTGSGTVTLSGGSGNTFTGTTTVSAGTLLLDKASGNALATNVTVNGGTLLLGAANQIAAATVTLGGGTFDIAGFNETIGTLQLNSGTLAGSGGTLTATTYNLAGGTVDGNLGAGTINASASTSLNGTAAATTINITGGTLSLGSAGRLIGTTPTVLITNGATLDLTGNESIGTLNLTNGTVSGSGTLSVANAINAQSGTLSANISGNAGLTKTTASTVTLSGANTFSGAVAVNGGTLILTNGSALSDSAAVTLANTAGVVLEVDSNETIGSLAGGGATGGTVALDVNTLTLNQSVNTTYTGTVTGAGVLAKTGAGTVTLNRTTAVGADFDLRISQGTVDLNRGTGVAIAGILGAGNSVILDGGTLSVSASSGANGALTLGSLDVVGNSTLLINRLGSSASHSTTLTAPLNFSNNGVLNFAYSSLMTGGTTTLAGSTNTLYSGGTINVTNYTVSILNAIEESGGAHSLTKAGAGTVQLNATNTYTGNTAVTGGELRLAGSGRISDSSLVAVSSGATMNFNNISDTVKGIGGAGTVSLGSGTLTTSNSATDTFSGAMGGTGGYVKAGAGTQVFSGASANTYSGTTTVSGGTLELNKTPGVNAIAGNVTVNSGATLLLSASDNVANTSAVTLSGGTILRGSGVSETFGALTLGATGGTLDFGAGAIGSLNFGTYTPPTPSALLAVNSFLEGNVLTFKSDLSAYLPTLQGGGFSSALFSFDNGFVSSWDSGTSTFTITAIPEPSTYLAAAGLLSLMLWPSRKRLLKDAKKILGMTPPMRDRLAKARQ